MRPTRYAASGRERPIRGDAQVLTEHLGWSYDRYDTRLADAIERLVLND